MRKILANVASIESVFLSFQRPYICRACSRRFPAALRTTASFSTTARRQAEDAEEDEDRGASSWEHLEWVGTPRWIDEYMQPRNPLKPFSPIPMDRDPDVLKDHVLKSLAETFLAPKSKKSRTLAQPADVHWPKAVQLSSHPDKSKPEVKFASDQDKEAFIEQLFILVREPTGRDTPTSEIAQEPAESSPDEKDVVAYDFEPHSEDDAAVDDGIHKESFPIEVADSSWMRISLENPTLKFKVIKRIMQRTGIKLPDNLIQQCDTVGALYRRLLEKPKPRKLAHIVQADTNLTMLQNVQLHQRRINDVTEDKALGRWKVIQQELAERGLPEFNSAFKADQGRKYMRWKSVRYKKNFITNPVQP